MKILSEDDIDKENTLEENIEIKNNQYVHSSPIARDVSKIEIIKLTNKYREECMRMDFFFLKNGTIIVRIEDKEKE